jgi:two-component system, sensor histidine kinase and response regulator
VTGSAGRVLVIEDDEAMRAVIIDILRDEGYEIGAAADGVNGLTLAAELHPDLVLCDIVMPGLSGYGVLNALRHDPSTAATPVIFLTGMSGPEALRTGMDLGADDYLVKPLDRSALLSAIATRLARSATLRREADARLNGLRNELARSLLPHELLTPLTVVMGLSSLLTEEGVIDAKDTPEVGQGILEASRALQTIIEKFLAYAELHVAMPSPEAALGADAAFDITEEEARQSALRAHRPDDLDLWGVPVSVPMPPDHWRMLVRELADNALKFSRRGSRVAVGLTTSGGEPILIVRDRGQGMSAEDRDALDQRAPFLRRRPDQPGLGLGLSMVRKLLQLHGGALSFETRAGQGTQARVRFWSPPRGGGLAP